MSFNKFFSNNFASNVYLSWDITSTYEHYHDVWNQDSATSWNTNFPHYKNFLGCKIQFLVTFQTCENVICQ